MARHRVLPGNPAAGFVVDAAIAKAAQQLASWTASRPPAKAKSRRSFSDAQMRKADDQLEDMLNSGDWTAAEPRHFLALYIKLYSRVYGVAPIFTTNERYFAICLAGNCMKSHFDDDPTEFALFMRSTWKREEGKERWCREKSIQRNRSIGWRLMFSSALLNEYLIERARASKAAR